MSSNALVSGPGEQPRRRPEPRQQAGMLRELVARAAPYFSNTRVLVVSGVSCIVVGAILMAQPTSKTIEPYPPGPGPVPKVPRAECSEVAVPKGTTIMQITNNEWSDGVVFCRGPVEDSLTRVFLDAQMTQPVPGSPLDCRDPNSPAAKAFGVGVPQGSTLALGLKRGESQCLYIAADGQWPSGACWYQDEASNKAVSIAKGPQYMSEVEFTIQASGQGAVWYDMSSVEGVSGGITMDYTDDQGKTQHDRAVPGPFQGSELKVVKAPGIGFRTVLSDKNFLGACTCLKFDPLDANCNSDACYAGCPGSLVDNPCGQHRCRTFYAKRYEDPTSYCGWLYGEKAQTYCWAMDEWKCVDPSCGYGGPDQPAQETPSPVRKFLGSLRWSPPSAGGNSTSEIVPLSDEQARADPLFKAKVIKKGYRDGDEEHLTETQVRRHLLAEAASPVRNLFGSQISELPPSFGVRALDMQPETRPSSPMPRKRPSVAPEVSMFLKLGGEEIEYDDAKPQTVADVGAEPPRARRIGVFFAGSFSLIFLGALLWAQVFAGRTGVTPPPALPSPPEAQTAAAAPAEPKTPATTPSFAHPSHGDL